VCLGSFLWRNVWSRLKAGACPNDGPTRSAAPAQLTVCHCNPCPISSGTRQAAWCVCYLVPQISRSSVENVPMMR
jgi:hypothetical protein